MRSVQSWATRAYKRVLSESLDPSAGTLNGRLRFHLEGSLYYSLHSDNNVGRRFHSDDCIVSVVRLSQSLDEIKLSLSQTHHPTLTGPGGSGESRGGGGRMREGGRDGGEENEGGGTLGPWGIGITRRGPTCYVNAWLQVLFRIPSFTEKLDTLCRTVVKTADMPMPEDVFGSHNLTVALNTVLQTMITSGDNSHNQPIDPQQLLRCLAQVGINLSEHQDVFEAWMKISKAIEDTAKQFSVDSPTKIFEVHLQHLDTCQTCFYVTQRVENPLPALILKSGRSSLGSETELTLDAMMRAHFQNGEYHNIHMDDLL